MTASITRREVVVGSCLFAGVVTLGGVTKALASGDDLVRPPGGQDERRLQALCIKCDRCRGVCPTGCVSVAAVTDGFLNARMPKLDFHKGFCDFCNRCIEVCPTGALLSFDPSIDKIGVAHLDTTCCVAYTVGACDKCRDSCRYDALVFNDFGLPTITSELCNGCGACVDACVVNVYRVFNGVYRRAIEVVRETS